jgi:hypothetical protein
MSNTRGLLYPALHKFYSSLSSLEKFEKGTNFFDNITYLDNFFFRVQEYHMAEGNTVHLVIAALCKNLVNAMVVI